MPRNSGVLSACALVAGLFFSQPAVALDPGIALNRYILDNWQSESGLPQNSVLAILQTRDGYLWFGTQEGVARFDGVRFAVFDRTNTPAFQNNHVQALLEDQGGNLWIATYGGGLIRHTRGTFTRFSTSNGLSNDTVRALLEGRDGTLWIGTNGGLNRYRGGKFETVLSTRNGLAHDEVVALHEGADGALWIGTYGGGLHRWKDGQLTHYSTGEGLSNDKVWSIASDRDGALWVGTRDGLNRFSDGKFTVFRGKDVLPSDIVDCLLFDREGTLWVGTRGGLSRLHDGRFEAYTPKEGLPDAMVRALYEDAERNLWVGTYGGGLVRLTDRVIRMLTTEDGISEDVVRAILQDRNGGMWVGTYGNGINHIVDGKVETFTTSNSGLPHDRAWSVAEGNDGSIWIGTYGGGVSRYRDGTFTNYSTANGLAGDQVRCVYRDPSGAIWIGTNDGLSRFDGEKFTNYTTANGLTDNKVIALQSDARGVVWIGTARGVSRLENGRFDTISTSDGLWNPLVYSIHADREGTIWIGTAAGLARWSNGKLVPFGVKQGLFNEFVFHILEDDDGYLWMSSAKGIFRVAKRDFDDVVAGKAQSVTSISFGKADGMRSSECNGGFQPAGWKTTDGSLWFPTIKGIAIVEPWRTHVNKRPPPVIIESLVVDGIALPMTREQLPPGSTRFEFHYTALTLVSPEKVKFLYRLEGFDKGWIDAGSRRVAYYTNLPAGDYRFTVKACNNAGVWSTSSPSIAFRVRPHFWQTSWFYAVAGILIAGLVFGLFGLRTRQLRKREQQLIALVEERTKTIAEQHAAVVRAAEEVQHLAYHDVLTGLPNRALFMDRLIVAVAEGRRGLGRPAVLFLDVDRFKDINDSVGHSFGDGVLRHVAERVRVSVREADSVARFGGDEFTILMNLERTEDAARVAEKILEQVRQPLHLGDRELVVTASLGISIFPDDGDTAESLVMNADTAMYRAKDQGRNHHQMYAPSMNATAAQRLGLENELRRAVQQEGLELFYQPIFDLASGTITGAEALVRWRHPERGLLLPADFIDLAEVSGLIIPMGAWVLRTACIAARAWQRDARSIVSVNLSARQFHQSDVVQEVRNVLDETGLDPSLLHLEITESSAMRDPAVALRTLEEIRELGVRIALDDFGVGYSSLSYLKRFPIDLIKLDQSFVRDLPSNPVDRAIAGALIAVAHSLNIRVVAEGVENAGQLAVLREYGFDGVQGFLFSEPLTREEFERLLTGARRAVATQA